ncbi:MAG: redoxin domain-containing protein [Pseudomonadota bacterium]
MSFITMKPFRGLLAAATVAVGLSASAALAAPEIGKMAPDFVGTNTKGEAVKLSELRGKTVILEWTNHGCPYVQKHYGTGNMQALQQQAQKDGIVWLSIISSAPGTQGYVKAAKADELTTSRKALPASVVLDPEGKIGRLYDARTTPHMYIITPDGKLAYKGAIDDKPTARYSDVKAANNYVSNALKLIQAGKAVDPAITRAYGCSVKYAS